MLMKILSLQQPYAYLVTCGTKNIENRSRPTRYRGPFLVHASLNVDREACEDYGFDPAISNEVAWSAWPKLSIV